jgi:branched-chain amino acid aminotransferase
MAACWSFVEGAWHEGNVPLLRVQDQGTWLGTVVFDGARAFEGRVPDLDLHCQRVLRSGEALMLPSPVTAERFLELALEGARKFAPGSTLYIRPMLFARAGFLLPDPTDIGHAMVIHEAPMSPPGTGFAAHIAEERRPMPSMAPTDAKASCLYPNGIRAIARARAAGFDNAVVLDGLGNVAEFASANLMIARDGEVLTPVPNGTFLDGITRRRIIGLLRADGVTVREVTLTPADLRSADEIFSTGNYGKVSPVTRFEARTLQPGPIARRARELYWDWSASAPL